MRQDSVTQPSCTRTTAAVPETRIISSIISWMRERKANDQSRRRVPGTFPVHPSADLTVPSFSLPAEANADVDYFITEAAVDIRAEVL
uniref:Uncharacterized protein n=1 Tax=Mycena chlorophos TaxID=658473 RepID=A0ABQ0M4P0_MYCCL|nr:predicted protein [Mycena chlorophos]